MKLLNALMPLLQDEDVIKQIVDAASSTPGMEMFGSMLEGMLK
ncbi:MULTISPECIES: hypothetical protein [Parabacteroides]|nr:MULTISPECIES: hypothetical protein [Parabacteroides]